MLNDQHLSRVIERQVIAATLISSASPTPTVVAAALALSVAPSDIIKSLLFLAADRPYLLIIAGEARVDMKLLRDALGLSRRQLRLASPQETLAMSGYPPGAMPPFGHQQVLPTLVDSNSIDITAADRVVYGGGGSASAMLKLTVGVLLKVTQARS